MGSWAPGASYLFRTEPFPAQWWPLLLLCFLPSFLAIEADKLVRAVSRSVRGHASGKR